MKYRNLIVVLFVFLMVTTGSFIYCYTDEISDIVFTGNEYIAENELRSLYFPDEESTKLLYILKEKIFPKKKHPGVRHAEIRILDLHHVTVVIDEEPAVCEIENSGKYIVLADNKAVLAVQTESSGKTRMTAEGFTDQHEFDVLSGEAREKINVMFAYLLEAADYGIYFDAISAEDGVQAVLSDVTVCFGDEKYMKEKMKVLSEQKHMLEGLHGTLYLDTYDPAGTQEKYYFTVN